MRDSIPSRWDLVMESRQACGRSREAHDSSLGGRERQLYSRRVRITWLCLALTGCVAPGVTVHFPVEDLELAFLIEMEGEALIAVSPAFALRDGVPSAGFPVVSTISAGSQLSLVGFTGAELHKLNPLIDLDRVLESRLRTAADESCAERFDVERKQILATLPGSVRSFELTRSKPAEAHPTPARLLARFRLEAPLADRPCRPPVSVVPFARDGAALSDGFSHQGARMRFEATGENELFFQFVDAQLMPNGEVLGITRGALMVLERGARLDSDEDPHFTAVVDPLFAWPYPSRVQSFDSFVVLPDASDSDRTVILLVMRTPLYEDPVQTSLLSIEYEGGRFRVLTSTAVLGESTRAVVDHQGRGLVGVRHGAPARSHIFWTTDGQTLQHGELPSLVTEIVPSPNAERPHILYLGGEPRVVLTDATRAELQPTDLELPPPTLEPGLRSGAAFLEDGRVTLALGSEVETIYLLRVQRPAEPIRVAIDGFTALTPCGASADPCGFVAGRTEAEAMSVVEREGQPRWLLYLPRFCRQVMAIREDRCTTHIPIPSPVPALSTRSLRSLRFTPEGDRAILAGSEGRLFELVIDP